MTNAAVVPLFSSPLYINNVEDFEKPSLDKLEFIRADGVFWTSKNTYILELPEFANIKKIIEHNIDIYTRDVLMCSNNIKFRITNSIELPNETSSVKVNKTVRNEALLRSTHPASHHSIKS